jgi:hypothetical protein
MLEVKARMWRNDARLPVLTKDGDACADLARKGGGTK